MGMKKHLVQPVTDADPVPKDLPREVVHYAASAAIGALWTRFRASNIERLGVLEEAATALLDGGLDDDLRRRAEREAHRLAGSVGTFGFVDGSRLAREIERLLGGSASLRQQEVLRCTELVVGLRQELDRPPPASTLPADQSGRTSRLLLLSEDPDLAERVILEASRQGFGEWTSSGLSVDVATIVGYRPDLVLLDVHAADAVPAGMRLLARLTGRTPPVPALVLAGADVPIDRVDVARLGGRAFIQLPAPAPLIVETAARVLRQLDPPEARVLLVDDDDVLLAALRTLLEDRHLRVTTLSDASRFWKVLDEVGPDLVILDVEMPQANGIDLARALRNDPRWAAMPIMFLTAHDDSETITRVFAAGADDFIAKPVVGPELVARTLNRLERLQILRSVGSTDGLTGVASSRKLTESATVLLRMAERHVQPVSFGVLDLDHFKRINAEFGRAAGDQVLRRIGEILLSAFRGEDVVSRWGDDEFLVALYGMDSIDAAHRLAEVLEQLRLETFTAPDRGQFHMTFTAGVAQYPDDGENLEALIQAAEAALAAAKLGGRDRVVSAGGSTDRSGALTAVEVAVVEDDDTLAGLLLGALQTRGYRTARFADGRTAVDALSGTLRTHDARVVLLDVDLPGLDGVSVLRRMHRDGALRDTRVIMLTVRAGEDEILAALELGAFDHVAKPFSLPVLMHRVRRALRT